jgi:hypothetical protein
MENRAISEQKQFFSSPFLFSATWAELRIEMNEHKAIPWRRLKAQIKRSPPPDPGPAQHPVKHPRAKP